MFAIKITLLIKPSLCAQTEEVLDARQKIMLFDYDLLNCRLIKMCKKMLFPCDSVTNEFDQFRSRFEDGLKIFRSQSEEQTRSDCR